MPQPSLPAPLAQRPDPGAQLLESVRQRQAQRSLQLAQQLVHRRGINDLQRFCSSVLGRAQGPEAVAWLQGLLSHDGPIPRNAPDPRPEATAVPPALSLPSPLPEQPDLGARAVAAVDAAFAALAQSFQEEETAEAGPAPMTFTAEPEPSPEPKQAPAPLPVRGGLWPSLRASAASLGAALRPGGEPAPSGPAEQPDLAAATCGPAPSAALDAGLPLEAPIPQDLPTVAESPTPRTGSDDVTIIAGLATVDPAPASADPPAGDQPIAVDTTAGPGLMQSLRGRIQTGRLSRLRAVVRDCVDETVALLRTPTPEHLEDEGVFEVSTPPEPALPVPDQPGFSWTLDPFLPATPVQQTISEPAPAPAPPQAPTSAADRSATAPSAPARSSRLRFGLPVARPAADGEMPAPAPDALADLRAWLPDRGDLPRAS